MSPVEYAWTSINGNASIFDYFASGGSGRENRFHPTQKPVALYKWLLQNYAKSGDRILDTHGGSFSSAIACHDLGFDFTGCELDKDYYDAAVKRYEKHKQQPDMFRPEPTEIIQESLI